MSIKKEFYLKKFKWKIIIVKIWWEVLTSKKILFWILQDIKSFIDHWMKVILVHWWWKQVDELSKELWHTPKKINWRRITWEKDLEVLKMICWWSLNIEISSILTMLWVRWVWLNWSDWHLLYVVRRPVKEHDYWFVWDILGVNIELILNLLKDDFVPIIAPLATDKKWTILNINADTIAMNIATAFKADKLILLTNVDWILENWKVVSIIDIQKWKECIDSKCVKDWMLVKLTNCLEALDLWVKRVHIINWTSKHSLVKEVFTKKGIWTMIVSQREKFKYLNE